MTPGERIRLIKLLAEDLARLDESEINLTLRQFGAPWTAEWFGTLNAYLLSMLEDAGDEVLLDLYNYRFEEVQDAPDALARIGPWEPGRFRLFLSHNSSEKALLGDVKRALAKFGIDGFLAHDDIEPTEEWLHVIELALKTCDALAAFLHPDFHLSKWTDHEVGYAVARQVLIIPIDFGLTPYGFIGRYQALPAAGVNASQLASTLFDVLIERELTRSKMAEGLVTAFVNADSYSDASDISKLMESRIQTWTPEMLRRVEENSQVGNAWYVPDRIQRIVEGARGDVAAS